MTIQTGNSTDDLKSNIENDVKSATAEIAGAAKVQAEAGKDQAAHKLNDLSEAIDQVASSISENDKLGLASYVHSTSSRLAALAGRLQDSSMDELAEDAKEFARSKPTAFLLGSVVVGFGLSRFVKASTHHHESNGADKRYEQSNYPSATDYAGSQNSSSRANAPLQARVDTP